MFGIGGTELVVLIVVIALLIGPEQIPDLVKSAQKLLGEIKTARREFNRSVDADETLRSIKETVKEVKTSVKTEVSSFTQGIENDINHIKEEIQKKE